MPKYTFYESFLYTSNTARYRNSTLIVNRVTVFTHPQKSLVERLTRRCRTAHYNRHTDKLYIRERVRKAKVLYTNQQRYQDPEFTESFSENYTLGITTHKGETNENH